MRTALVAPLALAAVTVIGVGAARGAPALPTSPANGAVVTTVRPAFVWTAGSSLLGIDHYEVYAEVGSAMPLLVLTAPAGTLSGTSTVYLPDDASFRWFIRIVDKAIPTGTEDTPTNERATVTVATPAAAPAITDGPTGPIRSATTSFAWTGTRIDSQWAVVNAAGAVVQSGGSPTASGRAVLNPLPDGAYVFRVVQRNVAGVAGAPATRPFAIDTTIPSPPTVRASRRSPTRGVTPSFQLSGLEPGAVVTWRVSDADGAVVRGPAQTTSATVVVPPLGPGSYVFEARQTDPIGNLGPWALEPFAILGTGGSTSGSAVALPRKDARKLRPAYGARITTVRPTLRWARGPRGTVVYNLQVFRVGAVGRLIKVDSAFPRRRRYTVPRRAHLRRGSCYVWRVWPYLGHRFTPHPLGVSGFCIRAALVSTKRSGRVSP